MSSHPRLAQAAVAAPFLALLACLIGQLTAGRAIIWTADSLSYVYPGVKLAAGADPTGLLAGRNVGYSLAAALVLPLGGLRALVTLQALFAAGGLAALLLCFRMVARNAYAFGVGGLLIVTAAYASDSFVLYSQMIRGDSMFGSLLSIALWLFLSAWRRTDGVRAGFLIGAVALSYAAYTFEPTGLLVLALTAGALAIVMVRSPRLLLRPRIGGAAAGLLALALSVQAYQAHIATKDGGFGPRALFCAHLDTILFHPAAATPERRALWALLDGMGRDANRCANEPAVLDAIQAAAKADDMTDGTWMKRQFLAAAARHPKTDVADILKQIGFYLRHPNLEPDLTYPSGVSDPDWERLSAYRDLIRAPRAELDRPMGSWFAQRHRVLAVLGKHLVGLVLRTLWLAAALALATAAIGIVRRRRIDGATERVYIGLSAFVLATVLSTAIPFTFAIPRYAASFANLTYLWWSVGLVYLVECLLRLPALGPAKRSIGRRTLLIGGSLRLSVRGAGRSLARRWAVAKPRIVSLAGNIALAICAPLTVGVIALQMGAAHVEQTFTGPFQGEQIAGSQLKTIAVKPLGALGCCLHVPADREGHGNDSQLRLWANDKEILPPHTPGVEIRKGNPGFSHWRGEIYFALPHGMPNSSQTRIRLDTPLKPDAWTMLFPAMTLALLIRLHGRRTMAWLGRGSSSASFAMKSPYLVLFAFGWTVVFAGAAYLATALWGLATGEALPLAIPFQSDLGRTLADVLDPAIPLALLLLAVFGVAWGWLATWSSNKMILREAEVSGLRWMRRYGLFCLVMFYLASVGATWAGSWRSGSSQTLLGLVPAFDSWGYFSSAHIFLHDGRMGEMLSRRPLAGALRVASLGISDFRFTVVLFWQALAMAGSTYFAAMAIMRWRGLWAGVVFVALAYIAVRTHLPTLLTEPLGLPIGIVALGFMAEAFRTSSRGHALLAIALLTEALWVRPGAMFVIPGLTLWFAWVFHETPRQKLKGFVIACVPVVAVIAVDKLLNAFFAGQAFQGELAYAFCGLSLGADWSACLTTYPQEYGKLAGNFDAEIAWLNAKAIYNIQHDPGLFLRAIVHEPVLFWTDIPRILLQGYSWTPVPRAFPSTLWLLTAPVFGVLSLRNRNLRVEAPFWIVTCLGLTASAVVVYSSDGVRAMAVTYPLLGLFVAAAFSSPIARRIVCARTARRELRLGAILTVAATAGLFVFLPLERLIYPSPRAALAPGESSANTAIVGDLARSTGVLVVADNQPLPHGVPAVHLSRFVELLRLSRFQSSQGIIEPKSPGVSFGFIEMPYLTGSGARILITPPDMVTRRDVRAWRIVFEGWNPTGQVNSSNWDHVVSATPYVGPISK